MFPVSDFCRYAEKLSACLAQQDWEPVSILADEMARAWKDGRRIFICGNGGSAANALHWANDFLYAVAKHGGKGLRILALSDNSSTLTCLANDLGYEYVFSAQLATQAQKDDLLIVLSGSGNSPNILEALRIAKEMELMSFAIVGYSGGKSREMADVVFHVPVDDMQLAEDLQIIVGHMVLKSLSESAKSGKIQ